jgi:hypothetical protein
VKGMKNVGMLNILVDIEMGKKGSLREKMR